MKIKTIDVKALTWFDRVNGNSYFSARVIVNYGTKSALTLRIPFQYGYGSQYEQEAFTALASFFCWPVNTSKVMLWKYCKECGIILRSNNQEGCLKKDVKYWGN